MKKVFVIFAVLTAMLLMVGCQNKSQVKKEWLCHFLCGIIGFDHFRVCSYQ